MLKSLLAVAAIATSPALAAAPKPVPMDYVEFKVHDIAQTKAFYGAIFGWQFTDYGPGYTSFTDNGLGGGFTTDGVPATGGPLMVFHVDNLEGTLAKAIAVRATIVKPIYSFPGGRRFEFKDPDGYDIAAWTQE